MSVYFHIDLDAFFASVEKLDDPSLEGEPVVVGGSLGHRGVVSTCSYEARAFGVRSAMPIGEAMRLCPQAVFLPVRMPRYVQLSSQVMGIFDGFTPSVIRVSIDEASLDMSGTDRLWGPPEIAAAAIKRRVEDGTGLSISIGVASNRYVAKIASGMRKPDGLVIVEPGGETVFMRGLRLKDLWGAGPKTRTRLESMGIDTIERLAALSPDALVSILGKAGGAFVMAAVNGEDPGIYGAEPKSRSISTEITFDTDVSDRETLESTLLSMAEELIARLYAEGGSSHCAVLKLRYEDFETVSIRETREEPFLSSSDLYEEASSLLGRKWNCKPLRLVGLGLSGLDGKGAGQGSLFDDPYAKSARVERAVLEAGRRGLGRLTKARLVPRPFASPLTGGDGEPE
jgi:DNA polymerase-4